MTKFRASKKIVILEPTENTTASGLKLAEAEGGKNKPELGVVKVIGEGKKPVDFEVGDTIVFGRYTENRISVRGKEYNFINFKDILAVVKD